MSSGACGRGYKIGIRTESAEYKLMFIEEERIMGRVIRGYWDCPSCGTKGIDGLLDACPHCGSAKNKNVRYYMKSRDDTVTEQELNNARISKDELDGKHRDWLCSYCGYLNRYSDKLCQQCSAPKEEKAGDYGDNFAKEDAEKAEKEKKREETLANVATSASASAPKRSKKAGPFSRLGMLFIPLLVLLFLFFPVGRTIEVTGFAWVRKVEVETYMTLKESDWSLPQGANLLYSENEVAYYQSVLDHYETEYVTRYREVIDHYETRYEYQDNGNGTFSEITYQDPVYVTEAYQVEEQVPIYVQVPMYQTKYYYEIDRWVITSEEKAQARDHDPYWPEYRLQRNQRDELREETYRTYFSDGSSRLESFRVWENRRLGDKISVKKSLAGISMGGE